MKTYMKSILRRLNRQKPPRKYPLSDFDRMSHELRPCDVILVEGRSSVSDIIRWLTNSPWTHAALYIGRIYDIEDKKLREKISAIYDGGPGDRLIIESELGLGTVVRPLNVYADEHLRLCRPARLSPRDSLAVVRIAVSQIGKDYDVRQIFDLMRLLLPWYLLPKRWASTLFERSTDQKTRTICSTMIAECFAQVEFPILPLVKHIDGGKTQLFRRNPRLCTPSDFDYSPYFEVIKYPFMDFYHEEYHLLPWQGPGTLSEEELGHYLEKNEVHPDEP
ncbi:MAG TPA: hypothetical protein DEQ32_06360 [Gammaproteobacteria bacterium]|nr:hypothetical protein [Gammaproteobacteria bacterium]